MEWQAATRELRTSRDVVFDELSSWYAAKNVVVENVSQQSQTLSGPGESLGSRSIDRPWSGRLHAQISPASLENVSQKGKEKVGEPTVRSDSFDGNSSGSYMSLDEEFGILAMRTLGVKKAMEAMHSKLRRSERTRNPVDRLTYDSYVARHYAYMAKVV